MGNVVGDLWNHRLRPDRWDALHRTGDEVDPLLVVALHRLLGVRENPVDRRNHAHNLLFRNLHAAADSVSWIIVRVGQVRKRLPAQQQPSILWTTDSLAPGKRHQVEAHAGVVPKIRDRRHVRGCVQVARNLVLVRHAQPLFAADLRAACDPILILRSVEKIRHHSVARAARALIVVERDHLGYTRSTEIHGAVILIAVRALHDHLILLPVQRLRHFQNVDVVCNRTGWSAAFCTAASTSGGMQAAVSVV